MSSRRNFNAPYRHRRKPDFFSACGGFITDTFHLARSDPSVAGGRCLIVGAGLGATGFAAVTLGAALETISFPIMILGALAAFGGKGKGPGLALLTAGVIAFAASKVLQATVVAAMITGGVTAFLGVGLIAVSRKNKLGLDPPHPEQSQEPRGASLLP